MDVRSYEPEASMPSSGNGTPENGTTQSSTISFKSSGIAADVQGFVDAGADGRQQFFAAVSLVNWGLQQWDRRSEEGDTDSWRAALTKAEEAQRGETPSALEWLANSGPGIVAAVCVRDHWENLSADDRQWCLDTIMAEVERNSNSDDYTTQISDNRMNPDRHGAYILPNILSYDPDNMAVFNVVAKAITHACDQVSLWAAEGASQYLASEHEDMMLRCVDAIAMQANLLDKHSNQSDYGGIQWPSGDGSVVQQVRAQVRDAFVAGAINVEKELESLDLTSWSGRHVAASILTILGKVPNWALSMDFFIKAAQGVVASWAAEHRDWNSERDFTFEYTVMTRLAGVAPTLPLDAAVHCCGPLLDAVDEHPKDVATFVELLISEEDLSSSDKSSFWEIWKTFANRVVDARWLPSIGSNYSEGMNLIDKMLFRMHWDEGIRRWHRLDGHEHNVDDFTTRLPAAAPVLLAYCHYLYTIGERALPRAFMVVADRIGAGDPKEVLSDGNTMFYLESLLRRYVYGQPLRLRSDPNLRKAVLTILDQLVDAGSSAAYRMRDDFVTPVSSIELLG